MPELPEVETVRQGLSSWVAGQSVTQVKSFRSDLRFPLPVDLSARLSGRVCRHIGRRGKYLLFDFGDVILVWHLGMTGQFHVLPVGAPQGRHEHLRIDLASGQSLRYRDMRRFGYLGLLQPGELVTHPWFASLGPEPLGPEFSAGYLNKVCQGRKAPIKNVLMDARVVVGVGNIYACESLYRATILPMRPASTLSAKEGAALVAEVQAVLEAAIAAGGSSISDFVQVDGKPGYFAHDFKVYGRAGQLCGRCGGMIERCVLAGRGTFYCNGCQH